MHPIAGFVYIYVMKPLEKTTVTKIQQLCNGKGPRYLILALLHILHEMDSFSGPALAIISGESWT